MRIRLFAAAVLVTALAACSFPAADLPAAPERLGRFMGLVVNCACSDVSPSQMLAGYPRVVAGRYGVAEIERMRPFIELGLNENYDNQLPICAEVCSQSCAVNAVVRPLGGRPVGDGAVCAVTERGLHLTSGWNDAN